MIKVTVSLSEQNHELIKLELIRLIDRDEKSRRFCPKCNFSQALNNLLDKLGEQNGK